MPPTLLNAGASPFGWHKLEAFIRCPRAYGLARVLEKAGLDTYSSAAQSLGSLIHTALAHHYARMRLEQAGGNPDDLYPPKDAVRAAAAASGAPQAAVEQACAVYDDYVLAWRHESLNVLHVEEVFHFQPAGAPRALTARVDLVYERRGLTYIVDHKSSHRITANHPKFYGISGQFLLFRWLGFLCWGERFGGAVVNLIQTGPTTFSRPPLPAAPDLLSQFPEYVRYYLDRIADLEASGLPYHRWPAAASEQTCFGRYGWCPHSESCLDGLRDT
jgi:hypothetical protein